MQVTTQYTLLNGMSCVNPKQEYENALEHNLDTSLWLNKANSYSNPLGSRPGQVYLLLLRSQLDSIDKNGLHTVELGLIGPEGEESITIPNCILIKAVNVTPGKDSDPNAVYFAEFADRRYLLYGIPLDLQVNIPVPNYPDKKYYDASLLNGVPYTWNSLCKTIWDKIGKIDVYPGLPYTPFGFPENYIFFGYDAWETLSIILAKIHCAIDYDIDSNRFNIVQIGIDPEFNDLEQSIAATRQIKNKDPIESERAKIPAFVRVYFNKKSLQYGTENSIDHSTNQFITNPVISIDVPAPLSVRLESSKYQIFHDDLAALVDYSGNITNADDLNARAADLANNYYTALIRGTERFNKLYHGIIGDLNPGGLVKLVNYYNVHTGSFTEVIRTIGMYEDNKFEDQYNHLKEFENLRPPDYSRATYPNYYPQSQLILLPEGTPNQQGIYDGIVENLDPDNLMLGEEVTCWVYKVPRDDQIFNVGTRVLGKANGNILVDGEIRPLFLFVGNSSYNPQGGNLLDIVVFDKGPITQDRQIYKGFIKVPNQTTGDLDTGNKIYIKVINVPDDVTDTTYKYVIRPGTLSFGRIFGPTTINNETLTLYYVDYQLIYAATQDRKTIITSLTSLLFDPQIFSLLPVSKGQALVTAQLGNTAFVTFINSLVQQLVNQETNIQNSLLILGDINNFFYSVNIALESYGVLVQIDVNSPIKFSTCPIIKNCVKIGLPLDNPTPNTGFLGLYNGASPFGTLFKSGVNQTSIGQEIEFPDSNPQYFPAIPAAIDSTGVFQDFDEKEYQINKLDWISTQDQNAILNKKGASLLLTQDPICNSIELNKVILDNPQSGQSNRFVIESGNNNAERTHILPVSAPAPATRSYLKILNYNASTGQITLEWSKDYAIPIKYVSNVCPTYTPVMKDISGTQINAITSLTVEYSQRTLLLCDSQTVTTTIAIDPTGCAAGSGSGSSSSNETGILVAGCSNTINSTLYATLIGESANCNCANGQVITLLYSSSTGKWSGSVILSGCTSSPTLNMSFYYLSGTDCTGFKADFSGCTTLTNQSPVFCSCNPFAVNFSINPIGCCTSALILKVTF